MKTTSVKTSSTPIDAVAEVSVTPFDLVAEMEEAWQASFLKPVRFTTTFEPVSLADLVKNGASGSRGLVKAMGGIPELRAFWDQRALADAKWTQRTRLLSLFGKYGLEKDEVALIAQAKDGLESIEDRMAALVSALDRIRSRKAWKEEQSAPQRQSNYKDLSLVYDLPPLVKGKRHEDAYYSIVLPDGRSADMAEQVGGYKPKLENYASRGVRLLAIRLGIITPDWRGGDTEVLNLMLGESQVEVEDESGNVSKVWKWLPAYVSSFDGLWHVKVGWKLNPSASHGEFHRTTPEGEEVAPFVESFDGELERYNPLLHTSDQILTASQLDYKLLCEASDLAVTNEDGEVVDYMNEQEEFLGCFPERENEPDFIDFSKYCDDDEEMELFSSVSGVVERSEQGITIGDIRSKQYRQDYLADGITRMKEAIAKIRNREPADEAEMEESLRILNNCQDNLARLERLEALADQMDAGAPADAVAYWYPKLTPMFTMGRDFDSHMPPVTTQDCMLVTPSNEIEKPVTHEADTMPRSTSFNLTLDDARRLRRRKVVCQSINKGRFGMLIREKKAADHFAMTLDTLLGIR